MARISKKAQYPVPVTFAQWLEEEWGRAAYFEKVDPHFPSPVISKLKKGIFPITFELAIRLERAQKASNNPLRAEDLMTFAEDRELYRYVTGRAAAPAQLAVVRKSPKTVIAPPA